MVVSASVAAPAAAVADDCANSLVGDRLSSEPLSNVLANAESTALFLSQEEEEEEVGVEGFSSGTSFW